MTNARRGMRAALSDFYHQSWRLLVLNAIFSIAIITVLIAASYAEPALLLDELIGPIAAAVMHCAVTLQQTAELRLRDALTGLRLHWRRGLALGSLATVVAALGVFAILFWARAGTIGALLAKLVFYLLLLFGVIQLALWPRAIVDRERPLSGVVADAALDVLRRPKAWVGLAVGLVLINLVGLAAALMPFLTLTIAYSFLAAAHVALPPRPSPEG
jgi:hypothetical protein